MSFRDNPLGELKVPLTWAAAIALVVAVVAATATTAATTSATPAVQVSGTFRSPRLSRKDT